MSKIAALIDFTEVTQKVIDFSARQARAHEAEVEVSSRHQDQGRLRYAKPREDQVPAYRRWQSFTPKR